MEPLPNHKRKIVKLDIYEDSMDKLMRSLHLIRHKLNNGDHIDPIIINDVVEICLEPKWNRTQMIRNFQIYTSRSAMDYFKKYKGYNFNKPRKNINFEYMLDEAIYTITSELFMNYESNKKTIIINLLKAIDKYLEGHLSEKEYPPYKRAVVTGFICAQVGMFKTQQQFDDADYNTYLFDKIKGIQKTYRAAQK